MLLYSPESVYQLDQAAVEIDTLPELQLMQRAGDAVWQALCRRWPQTAAITIFAGAGNNGGDAFVVAICARQQGVEVQLISRGDLDKQSATAKHFKQLWQRQGGIIEAWDRQAICGEIIVDGLLGIGLKRDLDQSWQQMINRINLCAVPRVAIDIPSGLNAATGIAQPVAIEATLTVTFIGAKTGQYLADGPDYCGELVYHDLGVSSRVLQSVEPSLQTIETCRLPQPRKNNSHKNQYGHVLVIGGDQGMSGAVALAAKAALRSGAGMVSALVHPRCCNNLAATPEIMVQSWDAIESGLAQASVVVIGPGLGNSEAARECREQLHDLELPMIVDASALDAEFLQALRSDQVVITPHPGEAASLLSITPAELQSDRLMACRHLIETYGMVCVLKGAGTLIADRQSPVMINTRGNPGMATAGMGDVLGGIIAALVGQGLTLIEAATSGVYIHALCAELYCQARDQSGLIASDIIERIPRVIRRLRDG